jgi:hypothetical protein
MFFWHISPEKHDLWENNAMPGRNKQQILDALFDDAGHDPKQPDKAYVRAKTLFFKSGIELQEDELAARRIWQKYHATKKAGRRRYLIPIVAAAAVALAIGILSFPQKSGESIAGKQTVSRSNFTEEFQRSVKLYVSRTENFSVYHRDAALRIAADTLTARIDFTATQTVKTVRIETPQVAFEIIGTKIVLDVNPEKARLHVSEGKVRVDYAGKSEIVDEGGIWEYTHGKVTQGDESEADEKLFEKLKTDLEKPAKAVPPRKKPEKLVRIILNNGTELFGRLIRENKEEIVISIALTGNQELVLKRENIRSMRSEGGTR